MSCKWISSILVCFSLALSLSACTMQSGKLAQESPGAASSVPTEFGNPEPAPAQPAETEIGQTLSQKEVLEAQDKKKKKVEVSFSARVRKLLPDDTKGLPHQQFLLLLDNGSTVKVAHDTKYAPRVPINEGDMLTIKGEYIWNRKGGVLHWTHHSDTPRHEGGYIDYNGQRYQ